MSVFAIMALIGPGVGCTASGWIEQNPHLEWRWIQWIHVMYVGKTRFCSSFAAQVYADIPP